MLHMIESVEYELRVCKISDWELYACRTLWKILLLNVFIEDDKILPYSGVESFWKACHNVLQAYTLEPQLPQPNSNRRHHAIVISRSTIRCAKWSEAIRNYAEIVTVLLDARTELGWLLRLVVFLVGCLVWLLLLGSEELIGSRGTRTCCYHWIVSLHSMMSIQLSDL